MTRLWLAALVLAGCMSEEEFPAEGAHLIVHITADMKFDQIDVTFFTSPSTPINPEHVQLQRPTDMFVYDHWELFQGPPHIKVTAQFQGTTIGHGEATEIRYVAVGDRTSSASITMHLTQ